MDEHAAQHGAVEGGAVLVSRESFRGVDNGARLWSLKRLSLVALSAFIMIMIMKLASVCLWSSTSLQRLGQSA